MRRRRRRKAIPIGLVFWLLVSAALGAGIGLLLRQESPQMVVQRWRQQLEEVPEDQVSETLQQALQNDKIGIPLLAAALASQREVVVDEAQRLLDQQLEQLQHRSPEEITSGLTRIASALSQHMAEFGPETQARAAGLAQQLLLWTSSGSGDDRVKLVAYCEQILRRQAGEETPPRVELPRVSISGSLPGTQAAPAHSPGTALAGGGTRDVEQSIEQWAALPGGGLPLEGVPMPSLPPTSSPSPAEMPAHSQSSPRTFPAHDQAQPIPGTEGPQRLPILPPAAPLHSAETNRPAGVGTDPNPLREPVARDFSPPADQHAVPVAGFDPAAASSLELVRALSAPGESVAAVARQELLRRGFSAHDFHLAEQFNAADAVARRELVARIVRSPTPLALYWLVWLSYDADPEVRLAAVSVLATSRDPAIMRRMDEIRRHESDPRITNLADLYLQRDRR